MAGNPDFVYYQGRVAAKQLNESKLIIPLSITETTRTAIRKGLVMLRAHQNYFEHAKYIGDDNLAPLEIARAEAIEDFTRARRINLDALQEYLVEDI